MIPLTFPLPGPAGIAYFNQIAQPDDMALIPATQAGILGQVARGKRLLVFANWSQAETQLDALLDQVEVVGYNPEHWANTPLAEQNSLDATVAQAAAFVHARNRTLLVAPDRQFADALTYEIASHADALLFQGQRLQTSPADFGAWVTARANQARSAHAGVLVYAQVSTTLGATVDQLYAALAMIDGIIDGRSSIVDGISIWTDNASLPTLQNLVAQLRP